MKSPIKTTLAALTLAFSTTIAHAEDPTGSEVALFLTITTQDGQRDALVALWDTHLRTRADENEAQVSYVLALDMNDPNTVYISEVFATMEAFENNSQAPWFASYMAEVGPLLAGEPEFAMAAPHWIK